MIDAFRLSDAFLLEVTGRDAGRYLNARLTADLRNPQAGTGVLAAALSAQGRVEGFFYVGCRGKDDFLLVCDGGDPSAVMAAFRRFIVADRVSVVHRTDLIAFHLIAKDATLVLPSWLASPQTLPPLGCSNAGEITTMVRQRSETSGFDVVFPSGMMGAFQGWLAEIGGRLRSGAELLELRFRAALPSFPQELSPDRLFTYDLCPDAISFTKGCYVGQEVMEKVAAYGKAPRELRCIAIEGAQVLSGDLTVVLAEHSIGEVLSSERENRIDGVTYCFASVRPGQELTRASVSGRRVVAVVR